MGKEPHTESTRRNHNDAGPLESSPCYDAEPKPSKEDEEEQESESMGQVDQKHEEATSENSGSSRNWYTGFRASVNDCLVDKRQPIGFGRRQRP